MKIFTHTYNITIFKNGKFCWESHGWVKKQTLNVTGFDLMFVLAIAYIIFN